MIMMKDYEKFARISADRSSILAGIFLARLRAGCGTQQRAYTDDPWCQLKEAL